MTPDSTDRDCALLYSVHLVQCIMTPSLLRYEVGRAGNGQGLVGQSGTSIDAAFPWPVLHASLSPRFRFHNQSQKR